MKVLITGASGYIGTILRDIFAHDDVTLLSRTTITPHDNEQWFASGNLQDNGWWSSLPIERSYDVVFHLAEPVKEKLGNRIKQEIVNGHVEFIRHFTAKGAKVIYPLTAYLYDRKLSLSKRVYAEIKLDVYRRLIDNKHVSFPIIHPICDSGFGLGKIIKMEKHIPSINIMCAFYSTIPILRLQRLIEIFSDPSSMAHGRVDIYSDIPSVKDIFGDARRANVFLLSRAIYCFMKPLTFVSSIALLLQGRHIDDSTF